MVSTFISEDAARRLRHGVSWLRREDIVRMVGTPLPGEPVQLMDEQGELLGLGDLDLESHAAVRRLTLADESPEGFFQRHLRAALERRGRWVQDPRYCRVVHEDGDGLPGLVVDRYDRHYIVQTFTRAMDVRLPELVRSLVEVAQPESVLLRNDSPRRKASGLPSARPHQLHGTTPRWARVLDGGARFSVDLHDGQGAGFSYHLREVRRAVARMARHGRVLDAWCGVGGLFVHAGLHGARVIRAIEPNPDAAELARENAEANGLGGRVELLQANPYEAITERAIYDLVLLDVPYLGAVDDAPKRVTELIRRCVGATRHGGRMVIAAYTPPLRVGELDVCIADACEAEGRLATRLSRPGLPGDYPTVVGAAGGEFLTAVCIELS